MGISLFWATFPLDVVQLFSGRLEIEIEVNERSWGKVLQTAQAAGMGAEGDASQSFVILQELKKTVRKSNI